MKLLEKQNLALFDLDGTLFNTDDVNYEAYREALSNYEINLDRDYYINQCNGRHYADFLPIIMGTSKYMENVHLVKKEAYKKYLNQARINYHLFNIIKGLKSTYYIAIVTTASRKNTLDILKFFNYEYLFDYLVTQEDVINIKPDPQGFLIAMSYFNVAAEHTIIFEDSEVGILAARSTGAATFVVNQF